MRAALWLCAALLLASVPGVRAEDEAAPAPPAVAPLVGDQAVAVPYNPAGRRDPFRPFTLVARPEVRTQLTPLQRYELGQLIVVGTVWELSPPRAVLEDTVGMGFIVTVGTPIGQNGGVVTAIEPQRVVVEERALDFYGKEQINRIVMETPKESTN